MDNKIKEKIRENIDIAVNGGATLIGGMLSDALVGQMLPGVASTILSYKQKRTEKMLLNAIEQLKCNINDIEEQLKSMTETEVNFIRNKAFPILFESIEKESQEGKIKFMVNGIKNIVTNRINDEDIIFTYYDILNQLRILDIKILINLYIESKKTVSIYEIDRSNRQLNIYEAIEEHVIKKLEMLGLIRVKMTPDYLNGINLRITPNMLNIKELGRNLIEFFGMNS